MTITSKTLVYLISTDQRVAADKGDIWRGELIDYFLDHGIKDVRSVLRVVEDLARNREHVHLGGLAFTLRLRT